MLHFSAGRITDHQGRYDNALRHLAKGKQLAPQEFDFEVLEKAVATCTGRPGPSAGKLPARCKLDQPVTPVFIPGLPRSGKTTLESLLARRRDIAACGEVTPRLFVDEDMVRSPEAIVDRLYGFLDVDMSAEEASVANATVVDLTDRIVGHWKNCRDLFSQMDTPAP